MEFKTVDVPPVARGRQALDNPFMEVIAEMAADFPGKIVAKQADIPLGGESAKTITNRIQNQLTKAAEPHGVTVSKTIVEGKDKVTLTFWLRPKIVRKAKTV